MRSEHTGGAGRLIHLSGHLEAIRAGFKCPDLALDLLEAESLTRDRDPSRLSVLTDRTQENLHRTGRLPTAPASATATRTVSPAQAPNMSAACERCRSGMTSRLLIGEIEPQLALRSQRMAGGSPGDRHVKKIIAAAAGRRLLGDRPWYVRLSLYQFLEKGCRGHTATT